MSARPVAVILAGMLFLAPFALAQEDRAVPRGGSSSGGGSHPSPGVHSSGDGSHSNPGVSSQSSSGSGQSSRSTAERRHPRAGTGRGSSGGYYPGRPVYPGYPGWGGGYYPGWGWSYWWPYSSYGWYGGYGSYPWGWSGGSVYHYVEGASGTIRVLVDPAEARVYVDGYYAGTVDDFDGLFQRLRLSPGRHEIAFKLEGYKTHRVRVYVGSSRTLKLSYELERGQGETFENLAGDLPEREARREREPREEDLPLGEGGAEAFAVGRLRLFVEPEDASVYVDGAFRGTSRDAASLRLSPGRHRVEVVRPGYRTEEREVEITADKPMELTVTLAKAPI